MTDDINYIWSDCCPTIFNYSDFSLTQDHILSLEEMKSQALPSNNWLYKDNELLRLNQFNIHKVSQAKEPGIRCFLKVSFSKEKYNLLGNSHNYLLDYDWDMKLRKLERNHPTVNH
jgi:hypothetical protein